MIYFLGLEGSSDVAASEKALGENDPKPFCNNHNFHICYFDSAVSC